MTLFMSALAVVLTLALAYLIDHEHFYYHLATNLFLEICTLFWIVFPGMK